MEMDEEELKELQEETSEDPQEGEKKRKEREEEEEVPKKQKIDSEGEKKPLKFLPNVFNGMEILLFQLPEDKKKTLQRSIIAYPFTLFLWFNAYR
jgi:hypothetical protein